MWRTAGNWRGILSQFFSVMPRSMTMYGGNWKPERLRARPSRLSDASNISGRQPSEGVSRYMRVSISKSSRRWKNLRASPHLSQLRGRPAPRPRHGNDDGGCEALDSANPHHVQRPQTSPLAPWGTGART